MLANVMENFRKVCWLTYGLDPTHFLSAPGLAWQAMLKFTKVELTPLKSIEEVEFIQKGIRGGICQCNVHEAHSGDSTCLVYLDANNLYGLAMSEKMPVKITSWMTEEQCFRTVRGKQFWPDKHPAFLEVDIEEVKDDSHDDLPFICTHHDFGSKVGRRLITAVGKVKNHIVHYKMFNLMLKNGLRCTKIHRALSFKKKHSSNHTSGSTQK